MFFYVEALDTMKFVWFCYYVSEVISWTLLMTDWTKTCILTCTLRLIQISWYYKGMNYIKSTKAKYVLDRVPLSCQIWFICGGHLICTGYVFDNSYILFAIFVSLVGMLRQYDLNGMPDIYAGRYYFKHLILLPWTLIELLYVQEKWFRCC